MSEWDEEAKNRRADGRPGRWDGDKNPFYQGRLPLPEPNHGKILMDANRLLAGPLVLSSETTTKPARDLCGSIMALGLEYAKHRRKHLLEDYATHQCAALSWEKTEVETRAIVWDIWQERLPSEALVAKRRALASKANYASKYRMEKEKKAAELWECLTLLEREIRRASTTTANTDPATATTASPSAKEKRASPTALPAAKERKVRAPSDVEDDD